MALPAFDKLLLENGSHIAKLDRYINYLTMVLPGQTPGVELACEAVVSSTSLLQLYKNQVVARLTDKSQKSLNSKFLDAVFKAHKRYRMLAYILSLVKSTELLAEMSAQHFKGKRGKWNAIIGIETLKAALRLGMLAISHRALPSTVPLHDTDLSQEEVLKLVQAYESKDGSSYTKFSPNMDDLRSRELRPINIDQIRPPIQLLRSVNGRLAACEVVSILWPLVYSLLLYKYRKSRKSWKPWLIGFSLEFMAREFAKSIMRSTGRMTALEKEVYGDRGGDLLWWLMRGAAFEHYTKKVLVGTAKKLLRIPLLNAPGTLLEDALEYFDEYYFAAATM